MSQLSAPHQAIRNQINPANSRRALVVEGTDDVAFVERQLDQRRPGWRSSWVVGHAGGKKRVRSILQLEPTWLGLVDSDEWDVATLARLPVTDPRLHVLPRYCMESYYIVARELWGMLPPARTAAIRGGIIAFETALLGPLPLWVRHGALWRVVNPLWAGLQAQGFARDLLELNAAQNDLTIQTRLGEWHRYLDPRARFAEFENELAAANALAPEDQLNQRVHGKSFFTEHVCHTLNGYFGQKSAADWLSELTRDAPVFPELDPVWVAMGL